MCGYCQPDELGMCEPIRKDEWAHVFLYSIPHGKGCIWFLQTHFYGGEGFIGGGANVRVRNCPMCGRKLV